MSHSVTSHDALQGPPSHRPKRDIEVLSQEIDEQEGWYRIRVEHRVYYLTITTDVYDEDTMCIPYLLIPSLPDLPETEWTTMRISRRADSSLSTSISFDELPGVDTQAIWHPERIDVLSLERTKWHRSNVHEVLFRGQPAITKIARWAHEIPRVQNETMAYATISQYQSQHPNEPPIAPKFLGHLTENGRVMGLLLEKVEGRFASIEDECKCEEAVRRLHGIGLIHGDVNRYNFLIALDGTVRMVDFEHVEEISMMRRSLKSLGLCHLN